MDWLARSERLVGVGARGHAIEEVHRRAACRIEVHLVTLSACECERRCAAVVIERDTVAEAREGFAIGAVGVGDERGRPRDARRPTTPSS